MRGRAQSRHPIAGNAPDDAPADARESDEAGFTLIELVVVVAILPLVIGGITAALLGVFGLQNQTTNRIGDSNDVLTSSSFFNKDVQSAAGNRNVHDAGLRDHRPDADPRAGVGTRMRTAATTLSSPDVLTAGNGFGSGTSRRNT